MCTDNSLPYLNLRRLKSFLDRARKGCYDEANVRSCTYECGGDDDMITIYAISGTVRVIDKESLFPRLKHY
jgi:hypothetical protein